MGAMIATAKDKGDAGCDVKYGHGIVQAKAAFEYLEANACDPNEAFKEPEGGCAEFSCSENSECDDGNSDTIDTCVSGSCQHACGSDAACDDEDPCTADTCDNGVCSSVMDCSLCGGGASCVLELTTDNYPGETSWDIKDSSGDEKYNGSGYSDANTLYTLNMCLETDEYTFYITDTYGDGICCSYGNGGYKIKVNGEEVVSGGEFGDSETETFTVNASPVAPPTPFPTTAPPTTAPVTPPTTAPVTAPVAPPTPTSDTCEMFVFSLTTDQFGYETSFELVNDLTGGIRLAGGLYSSSMTFEEVSPSPTEDISLLYLIHMAMEFAAIMETATIKFCFQVKLSGKVVTLANLKHSRLMLDHQDQRMHQLLHLLVFKRMRLVLRVINAAVVDAGLTNATSYHKIRKKRKKVNKKIYIIKN